MSSLEMGSEALGGTTFAELSGMNHRRELIEKAAANGGFSVLGQWITTETLHPTQPAEVYGPKELTFRELMRQQTMQPDAIVIPIQPTAAEQQTAAELSQAS